jgi:hypothetical protein
MEKEFVTEKQALALKELGFNEPCMASDYYATGKILIEHADEGITNKELDILTEECNEDAIENGDDPIPYNATIPLKQQAFRWFREKHGLHGLVSGFGDGKYECSIWKKLNILNSKSYCENYEEAESACLDELIEICKNK